MCGSQFSKLALLALARGTAVARIVEAPAPDSLVLKDIAQNVILMYRSSALASQSSSLTMTK